MLVIDKPAGPSSHDVVAWVRSVLGERRVGHCGTLDPAATGVLVVCVGEATKLVSWLTDDDKRYVATIALGRSTTTADAEGETIASAIVTDDDLTRAGDTIATLRGPLLLPPPNVSAVRVDGVRAHARVRAGEAFTLPERTMMVHAATLESIDRTAQTLTVTFDVGKGTYIRSLAEHVGARVGVPAHLASLRRLATGRFTIDAVATGPIRADFSGVRPDGKPRHRLAAADGATPEQTRARLFAALIPAHDAAPASWPRVRVDDAALFARVCNGVDYDPAALGLPDLGESRFALVGGPEGANAWVVARLEPGPPARVRPVRVLHPPGPPAA